MRVIKKIIIILITIFLVLLLSYNIYKFTCTNILKKDIVTINGYAVLEVVSGSMEPTINIGDIVIINTKEKKYNKDDIVTFYDKDGAFVTHRIVSISNNEIITKGDNNNIEDEPIDTSKLVGKYVLKVNKGQKIISALKNPLIASLILVNGILFCIFVSIDKKGNIVLNEEEREYQEFKKYLKKKNDK